MRKLKFHQILDVFAKIEGDTDARKFALDAIPLLRTDDGFRYMVDRLKAAEESGSAEELAAADQWFAILPFYKNPTKYMITSLAVSILITYSEST